LITDKIFSHIKVDIICPKELNNSSNLKKSRDKKLKRIEK